MNLEIRKRRKEDSEELAHKIAVVWNTTYKGIVEDEFLKHLLASEKYSAERLKNNLNEQPYYYVLTLEKKIIGWVYFTLESDLLKEAAEIHHLYVLKEYQQKGYGKKLYDYAVTKIKENHLHNLVVGCLDKNPTNEFYKHLGGKYLTNRLWREKYIENVYLFEI